MSNPMNPPENAGNANNNPGAGSARDVGWPSREAADTILQGIGIRSIEHLHAMLADPSTTQQVTENLHQHLPSGVTVSDILGMYGPYPSSSGTQPLPGAPAGPSNSQPTGPLNATELASRLDQIQQTIQRLELQQNQQVNQPAGPANTFGQHRPMRINYGRPKMYEGETRNDACDHFCISAAHWLRVEEQFSAGRLFTEDEKISLVSTYLGGNAQIHWQRWMTKKAAGGPDAPQTIYDFFKLLRSHFTSLNVILNRKREYETMKQTGPARDFILSILNLRNLLEPIPSDEDAKSRIFNGVKLRLQAKIDEHARTIMPLPLDEYVAWVISMDEVQYKKIVAQREFRRTGSGYNRSSNNNNGYSSQRLNAVHDNSVPTSFDESFDEEELLDEAEEGEIYEDEDEDEEFGLNAVQGARRFMRGSRGRGRGGRRFTPSRSPAPPNRFGSNNYTETRECYGCGQKGHLKANCPKARNQ
jgi:hypothetical protein